jgi:4-amino-4-deoxy-L-arabinose transferase-like glycosyltransferase
MLDYFPKYFTSKAIVLYLAALVVVSIIFFSKSLPFIWIMFGLAEVLGFFYFSNLVTKKWSVYSERLFTKKLFTTALIIRIIWVLFSYVFYLVMTGQPYEFYPGDVLFYHKISGQLADFGFDNYLNIFNDVGLSDRGYPTYLGVLYMVFGNGLIIPRLIKALLGAITALLVYKLGTRTFGEETGRIAGILAMLMPNLIYYTGSHLKEAEMVFLTVAFVERADYIIRTNKYNILNFLLPLALAAVLFTFRTVLGAAALFAFMTALLFSSSQVLKKTAKRVVLATWVMVAIAYFAGGRIALELEEIWEARKENQKTSMEWRAEREGGNKFAKYASASVFAPMVFVIPFPSMVNTPGQENQQLIHGGNFDKNILAFFVMLAMLIIIKTGKWRDYVLVGSFTISYLIVIALSSFAHSERFHQPAMPFLMIFAAYGITQVTNGTKKYYMWYIAVLFLAIIAWSWFKLAGRGLA